MLTIMSDDFKNVRSLFVVGDDGQCIYGFRGSKVDLILQFNEIFPQVNEIILNENYRSTQPILDLAEAVISHNSGQKKKNLFTNNPENSIKAKYYLARNERDEGDFIAKTVYDLYVRDPLLNDQSNVNNVNNVNDSDKSENDKGVDNEQTVFVPDEEPVKIIPKNDAISSMFDVYLDLDNLADKKVGSNLWSGTQNTYKNNYNFNSWQVPITNWSNVSKLNDVVILYRTHAQSRAIEESLLKNRIPYKLVSGTRFLDRKEIKDVLAVLRYINSDSDKIALSRFLPLILPGVGVKTMDKIYAFLEDSNYPLPPRYQEMVMSFITQISEVFNKHSLLIDFVKELLDMIGYFTYLKDQYPIKEEFNSRMENISELYSLMLQYDEAPELDLTEKINAFLAQVMLLTQSEANSKDKPGEEKDMYKISLMTLHQCKGLEFETVFMVGCEDGILPHQNSLYEASGMEEEVRLAYVGVTRAKKNLFLIAADSRVQFGQVKANPVSRIFRPFLDKFIRLA